MRARQPSPRTAKLLLATVLALILGVLATRDWKTAVTTDVLKLLPGATHSPELELLRTLANERQGRTVLAALESPGAPADARALDAAAQAFAARLLASGALTEAVVLGDEGPLKRLGTAVFEGRHELLLPGWLERAEQEHRTEGGGTPFPRWLAERTASRLETFLTQPEALVFERLLPRDPLLLVAEVGRDLAPFAGAGESPGRRLVWALAAEPPLLEQGQAPVFQAIENASTEAKATLPSLEVRWTSVSRFAASSRARAEAEVSRLNLLSLGAVVLLVALTLRRPWRAWPLAWVLLLALPGATATTLLVFGEVHALVFALGSLLAGVAIDYGLYLFLVADGFAGAPRERVPRLLTPLLASSLSTILGFALLGLADLPLLRQVSVFVVAGLLLALLAAVLSACQAKTPVEVRQALGNTSRLPGAIRGTALAVAAAVIALGLPSVRWRDDIRDLDAGDPALRVNDSAVRRAFGEAHGRSLHLTQARSLEEAPARLEAFRRWAAQAQTGVRLASVGMLLPSPAALAELPRRLAQCEGFEAELRTALTARGFDADSFAPFFGTWSSLRATASAAPAYNAVAGKLLGALEGPFGQFAGTSAQGVWFLWMAEPALPGLPPAAAHTTNLSQLETLNRVMVTYRTTTAWLSLAGLGALALGVLVTYGLARGLRIFSIPLLSGCGVLAGLTLAGVDLNLFHLLGAFLGVCLSHNYAIFSHETGAEQRSLTASIRLSALTTIASFGALATSTVPIVSSLGITVAAIVLAALCLVELVRPRLPAKP